MNHLDLCSGIGGFALAARWAGFATIGFCEIDPWCRRVLAKNFPGVPMHDDLTTLDAGTVRGWVSGVGHKADADRADGEARGGDRVRTESTERLQPACDRGEALDLVTAGYPCQPFSFAGKRLGQEDDRHLWPFIAALVDDLRPRWCLFENVAGHVTLGLDRVLADLEALGYAWGAAIVPACAVNAPHRRDRVWVMAHAEDRGVRCGSAPGQPGQPARGGEDAADAKGGERAAMPLGIAPRSGNGGQVESGLGLPDDGLPRWLARPWDGDWEHGVPRVTDGCTDRARKLKALGNAIVPQVAYEFLRLMAA